VSIYLARWIGFYIFVMMMSGGYYYNLTFVQLGLEDFATRILELSPRAFAMDMALLAILTCLTALVFGFWMQRQHWACCLRAKLRLAFGIVLTQTLLTAVVALVSHEIGFLIWLIFTSLVLGVGVPVMFSMTVDLVPVRLRGYAAALITAVAYFAAAAFSSEWSFAAFRYQCLVLLTAGTLGMGMLSFVNHPWLDALSNQHTQPEFAIGRFVWHLKAGRSQIKSRLLGLILIMFGIYFVDSLGFLRLLKTPVYMQTAWQSPNLDIRLFIAGVHVVGALVGGVLYTVLRDRSLFLWIFGIFGLTHLQYSFHIRMAEGATGILSMPMLYALAVSLYTVINFALWADLSTPQTISVNAALGVALSAWTATFLSTALSILWSDSLSLVYHIQIVDALAILFFLVMLVLVYFRSPLDQNNEVLN